MNSNLVLLLAGQGRAGQGRAGQGRAGQGRAGQGRAGQGRAGQGRAGQGRVVSMPRDIRTSRSAWVFWISGARRIRSSNFRSVCHGMRHDMQQHLHLNAPCST